METFNTEETLRNFAKSVIREARRGLTKQQKNVSKELHKSLDYNLVVSENSFDLSFIMAPYGIFQDRGVSGTEKKYKTAGLPGLRSEYRKRFSYKPSSNVLGMELATGTFAKWLKANKIRLRDKKGRFIDYKKAGIAVAINKKKFGIKPSLFFTKPFVKYYNNLPAELLDAYSLDVRDFLTFTINDILNDNLTND